MTDAETIEVLKELHELIEWEHPVSGREKLKALNRAIRAIEAQRWIPVSNPPEDSREVLLTEAGYAPTIARFIDGRWKSFCYGTELNGMTHWKPLPEGPK